MGLKCHCLYTRIRFLRNTQITNAILRDRKFNFPFIYLVYNDKFSFWHCRWSDDARWIYIFRICSAFCCCCCCCPRCGRLHNANTFAFGFSSLDFLHVVHARIRLHAVILCFNNKCCTFRLCRTVNLRKYI